MNPMTKTRTLILAASLAALPCIVSAQTAGTGQDSAPPPPAQGQQGVFQAHVLPPGAYEKLNLTADQRAQIKALEAQVQAGLQKILTAEQQQTLSSLRPPGRHHHRDGDGPGDGGPKGSEPPPQ